MAMQGCPSPGRPSDQYVQSFARGLQVIRSFSAAQPSQTISEVAARCDLTRAGARRILLTLQHLGYVSSDGKQFQLTPKILDLGFAYLSSMPLWSLAEPEIQATANETRESCSAAVLDGADIVYVMRVSAYQIISTNIAIGTRLPASNTSTGRVLLAGLPDEALRQLLHAHPSRAWTSQTITAPDMLFEKIIEARQQGWSVVNRELDDALISIAAPIRGRDGRSIAAINISSRSSWHTPETIQASYLARLQQATQSISRLLGLQA
ncbi:MAG: helix-turn-helix domain-containing protein [Burkholderiaceae bacterium]|jgi:IclR family pca regulon transcriptional regulator|nr:helix-turn-helix domain-containing protein [Burkholderiaceae bacterium]